jgi:hypothetical protein
MPLLNLESASETLLEGHDYSPTDLSPDGLRVWLLRVTNEAGVTPTQLAKLAKIAPSTVNKFLQRQGGASNLGARTIQKLTDALLVIHFDRKNEARIIQREEAGIVAAYVKLLATIRLGVIRENHLWPAPNHLMLSVPVPPNSARGLIGFAVADDEAGDIYPYGTVVVCSPHAVTGVESGQRFVVSRSNGRGETEIMLRQSVISPNADIWLTSLARKDRRTPDIYMGKLDETKLSENRDEGAYSIEYQVISSIRPEANLFDRVFFA